MQRFRFPFNMNNMFSKLLISLIFLNTLACPDPKGLRSDRVKDNFEPHLLAGDFYEVLYKDPA